MKKASSGSVVVYWGAPACVSLLCWNRKNTTINNPNPALLSLNFVGEILGLIVLLVLRWKYSLWKTCLAFSLLCREAEQDSCNNGAPLKYLLAHLHDLVYPEQLLPLVSFFSWCHFAPKNVPGCQSGSEILHQTDKGWYSCPWKNTQPVHVH